MKIKNILLAAVGITIGVTGAIESKKAFSADLFFPHTVYRTGAYAPSGIPSANGFRDYYALLNKRDGGIEGHKVVSEECEFKYNTKIGVECYEKLKGKHGGAMLVNPYSTGLTYQLIPKAPVNKIPILSMGYGRTAAADGRVFPWVFNFPSTYWSQASAVIGYIISEEKGWQNIAGKHIVHLYHNSAYGKEANPTLDALSKKFGFKLTKIAVDHPGQEQKAAWLQIRRKKPDWVFMSGWGVMNQVAIKEAANIKFPMDHFIGNWWSGSHADVTPSGKSSIGYKSSAMHATGTNWQAHRDILKYVYGGDEAKAKANKWGEVLYNRTILNAVFATEAVRTAQGKYGKKAMTGEQMRWGFENLNLTKARLAELGLGGFTNPVKVTCSDHETGGPIAIQQWDGNKWNIVSDWIKPFRDVVWPMVKSSAAKYAAENNIKPRTC